VLSATHSAQVAAWWDLPDGFETRHPYEQGAWARQDPHLAALAPPTVLAAPQSTAVRHIYFKDDPQARGFFGAPIAYR